MTSKQKAVKDIEKVIASVLPNKTLICTQPKYIHKWIKALAPVIYDSIELDTNEIMEILRTAKNSFIDLLADKIVKAKPIKIKEKF